MSDPSGSAEPPKDFRGKEIRVGDRIVYPGRSGSALWMNEAIVREIEPYTEILYDSVLVNPDAERWHERYRRVEVPVTRYRLHLDRFWTNGRGETGTTKSRTAILERVVVIS